MVVAGGNEQPIAGTVGAMRGCVSKRGDAWRVHVYVGLDAVTGKQRYLTRAVHGTKREAERICAELVTEADRGGFGDTTPGTLTELAMAAARLVDAGAPMLANPAYAGEVPTEEER